MHPPDVKYISASREPLQGYFEYIRARFDEFKVPICPLLEPVDEGTWVVSTTLSFPHPDKKRLGRQY